MKALFFWGGKCYNRYVGEESTAGESGGWARVDTACAPADAKYPDVRVPLPDGGARANAPDFTIFRGVGKKSAVY